MESIKLDRYAEKNKFKASKIYEENSIDEILYFKNKYDISIHKSIFLDINFKGIIKMDKLVKMRKCKKHIEKNIKEMNLDEAKKELKKYESLFQYDLDAKLLKINIYFLENKYDKADKLLSGIYNKYEYNHELNYNLAVIKFYKKEYKHSLYYLSSAMILNNDYIENNGGFLEEIINNISKSDCNKIKEKVNEKFKNSQQQFPLKVTNNDLLYGKVINGTHYCGIYDNYYDERLKITIENNTSYAVLTISELLPAKLYQELNIKSDEKYILPIMVDKDYQKLQIKVNNEINIFSNLLKNRFYYFKFNKNESINISSCDNFVAGNKIKMKKEKTKPSLILNIFIDGLSQKIIEENGLKNAAPNIYKFFKDGTICDNVYSMGEWTYVNIAGFFTGKYTNNHRIYNPKYDTNNLYNNELYSEILQREEYYCTKIDGDWRSNPAIGYTKGFDRYLYKPSMRGMQSEEIIIETIEHLETFKGINNFVWICIPDLHDIADEYETKNSVQVNCSIKSRAFEKTNEKSVKKKTDSNKEERYKIQLKRVDTYLNILFNYIRDNYEDDDILISLISDHGQGYLAKSDEFLDEERIKVPMMFRGKNIPKGTCDEFISGLDLMPIILKSIGVNDFDKKDGNIPKYFGGDKSRTHTYTESIFPGSPYYAALNDKKYKFFFTTKELCEEDGRVSIDGYKVKLIEKETGKDKTDEESKIVLEYTEEVLDHIKKYIII